MKIKIGNEVFDANDQPLMLILDSHDKRNISQMAPEATKYCACPEGMSEQEAKRFMKVPVDDGTLPLFSKEALS